MIRVQREQEKQGDLGDLRQKTKEELVYLLTRQEKLLANKKFLYQLKDRGARVESFAEKLRTLIAEREEVDKAMQLFERMNLGKVGDTITEVTERQHPGQVFAKDTAVARNERTTSAQSGMLHTSRTDKDSPSKHLEKQEKFKPNRDLKSTAIPSDLPRPNVKPSPSRDLSSRERLTDEQKDMEHSAVVFPLLRNQEAQVLEMAESASLLQEQKKAAEAHLAKHAAERLTERLNVKMGDFLPQVHDASYRSRIDGSDEGSGESGDEDDASGEEDEDD